MLLLISMFSAICAGEQLSFSRLQNGDNYRFNYQWLDANKVEQQISFELPRQTLFQQFRDFRAFKADKTNNYISRHILKAWPQQAINGVHLNMVKQQGQLSLSVKAPSQKLLEQAQKQLKQLEQDANQAFFQQHYYHSFTRYDGSKAIKPDHGRIAKESVANFKAIKPIILQTVSIKNIRKVTNYVLGFVQAIPYSPLESRVTSSGAGFNPPAKLLWENQGDCDSKVTLTASLLRALMPRIKIALVFIDGHALIGIEVSPQAGEYTVQAQGINYVLAEPTGPASYLLGQIAPESAAAIQGGQYSLEPFHADIN